MSIGEHFKDGPRMSSAKADYTELTGAKKDGGCAKVEVAGGVSKQRGCCNAFSAQSNKTTEFRCGTCSYLTEKP